MKLAHLGIGRSFAFGAFGSDAEDRDLLIPIARVRAARLFGPEATRAPVVVIGDTPLDVQCARAGGARVIAVATGLHDRDGLLTCAPDVLLDDLGDTGLVMGEIRRLGDAG